MDGDDFVPHFNRHLIICETHWHWSNDIYVLSAVLLKLMYISEKVDSWSYSTSQLDNKGKIHPHAAFVPGVCNKWAYFMHTMPQISSHLGPLKDAFSIKFLPALTRRSFSDFEISICSLSTRFGALGIGDARLLCNSNLYAQF